MGTMKKMIEILIMFQNKETFKIEKKNQKILRS